jgi:hypothetical protein
MRAVVTGMIAGYPVGGVAWDYLQYALGLEALGFEVHYLEDSGLPTYDPDRREYGEDCSAGVAFLEATLPAFSPALASRWHFRNAGGRTYGLAAGEIADVVAGADLFLNTSGGTLLRDEYMQSRRKVLIDTDPGRNHFRNWPAWDASPGWLGANSWRAHDHFFTYAECIGRPGCALPSLGISWQPTRPPVVSERWAPEPPGDRWTTVMTWAPPNYEKLEHDGVAYGTKELEFGRIERLPRLVPAAQFEVAVGGSGAPTARWKELGWSVQDSHAASRTAEAYRGYVQRSRGEFSVAKNAYVATRSGWFSCRSVCYLAAGRPVVLQDTGFSEVVPTGEGLLAFSDLDGAARAIEAVERDYAGHQQAAREVARRHFTAERVLGDLLDRIGLR